IMVYSTALGAIGTVGNVIVPLIFLGDVPDVVGFRITMVISGIAAGAIIYAASFYIQENQYTVMEESLGFVESIKETFKNKPFLIAEVTIFASTIMTQVISGYFIFLFDYVVSVLINPVNIIVFLILIAIVGVSIWWLTSNIEKYGIKRLMFLGGIISIGGFISLLFMGVGLGINQNNKMPFVLLFGPLTAVIFGYVGFMLLSQPLMGDCIDYDEVLTGKRRETTYSGVNALITKPAVSIGRSLFLFIIAMFGFQQSPRPGVPAPPPSEQPVSVGTGVIFAFTLIPTICLLIGLIALYFFPLEGVEWQKQKQEIHEIHQKKRRDYLKSLKEEGEIS
ncbi:MAG: MFS transporter, partial [Promethearchaeia archaeon]